MPNHKRTQGVEPILVSLESAAKMLQCSIKTMRRYVDRGELTAYRVGPRMIRIRVTDLERFVTADQMKPLDYGAEV